MQREKSLNIVWVKFDAYSKAKCTIEESEENQKSNKYNTKQLWGPAKAI